jgi:uncharacterized protein YggT (Ycf19 family)
MRCFIFYLIIAFYSTQEVHASVFWGPKSGLVRSSTSPFQSRHTLGTTKERHDLRWALKQQKSLASFKNSNYAQAAMAIPGYGLAEQVFVGGFMNFLSIYNLIITARILLSWFPQAQGIALLQPVYAITDPYLNLFRGIVPPLFGLDFSPILAFFLLNVLTSATAAVGAEIPQIDGNTRNRHQLQNMSAQFTGFSKDMK